MFRKCCVPKCDSQRQDVKLHRFPMKKVVRDQWLRFINCEKIAKMDNLVNKVFVCNKHFEKRFISTNNRLRLGAYPTLFTDMEITSGNPSSSSCTESVRNEIPTYSSDHSYSRKRRHCEHTYCTSSDGVRVPIPDFEQPSTSSQAPTWTSTSHSLDKNGKDCVQTESSITVATEQHAKGTSSQKMPDCTPRRFSKKRLIRDVKSLTPKCKLLYKEFKKASRQRNFHERAKRAMDFTKEKSFEELTAKMNPLAKKVLWMQVKLCMKTKKGRRFTMDEKLIGLAIYKQSPKSYNFLKKIFILPSKTTLKKMISHLDIEAGINPQIFGLIKEQVKNWNEQKRLCTILFDEMALEPAVTYSSNKDNIDGFVHLNEKTEQFADHALVFMLRGAVHKWQQPIAFYFCEGQTKSIHLKEIIKNIIAAVSEIGLQPIALISDQGASFQCAMNDLLEDTKRDQLRAGENVDNTIHICGNSISVFYDPPHLIKGMRNNMLSKDIIFEGKIATWQDIVDVYNTDCNHGESRIMHKLTDEHVIPGRIKKMKVKNCVRVFSKTVSAAMSYTAQFPLYPNGEPVSQTLKNTAEFLSFMDDLFDSVNGAAIIDKKKKSKCLRRAVTSKSRHHSFWTDAIKKLSNIKFITKDKKYKSVPSLKNWVATLKSFRRVWRYLSQKKNIKIMRPRYFNSDPIENFFGQVRAYNYRCNDPSVYTFKNTFKSLLITRYIKFHSDSFNCEDDTGKELLSIQSLFNNDNNAPNSESNTVDPTVTQQLTNNIENIQVQARRERISIHSRAYTVGWVTRKILQKIKCLKCKENLVTSDEESNVHEWIKAREYLSIKKRKLNYPTESAVRHFGIIMNITNEYLEEKAYHSNICKNIKQKIMTEYSFDFLDCESHREVVLEYFLNISIKLFIFNWCNVLNKILKGVDIIRLERSSLPQMQNKALCKYRKKLKNKKLNK